jgi:UDP-N-acetyl-alpha-D-muramoyl-L-alanyl-L-glutamate epimerase
MFTAEPTRRRADEFRYGSFELDAGAKELRCHYELDDETFLERLVLEGSDRADWEEGAVEAAAKWVFLLAGVSYYKAGAPRVVDLGDIRLDDEDVAFLRRFFVEGLGEFAYRNGLDLSGLEFRTAESGSLTSGQSERPAAEGPEVTGRTARRGAKHRETPPLLPLVPFGGGIDSIVTSDLVRRVAGDENTALFVVSNAGDRFEAIEAAAATAGLPVIRAERQLDVKVLRSAERGYLNGHVPVTGIISAVAVLAALLHGRDAVVMSNEASASAPSVQADGRAINHQWSKGAEFEAGFRAVLARSHIGVDYFSMLRGLSELWVARRFASLGRFFGVFRSCNRAFYVDRSARLDTWCGRCDKCCFVDLVLAPFLSREQLSGIFSGREPLGDPSLADRFHLLLGTSGAPRPFDCVGDVAECRTALRLAAERDDRQGDALIRQLHAALPAGEVPVGDLLLPSGRHFVPDAYAPADLLV